MQHVLLLPSWYPNDKNDIRGVFFRDQALSLVHNGYKVGVVAVNLRSLRTIFSKDNGDKSPQVEDDEGVITFRRRIWAALPRVPYGNYFLWRRAANALLHQYVGRNGWPDLVHAHSTLFGGAVAASWKRVYGLPYVLTEHSTAFARDKLAVWQIHMSRHAWMKADSRIAVSPSLGNLLSQRFKLNDMDWDWVPNVVADRFHWLSAIGQRVEHKPPRLLNLALMTEKKGQNDLLNAFSTAFPSPANIELWLAGDGPIRTRLHAQAKQLGISHRVKFLGRISPIDVPDLLQKVDVMVVSSHYETFGVVVAEALMAGIPVVATRCGGPECIVDQGDGLLVRPGAPEALAHALRRIINDLPLMDRNAIAKRAYKRFSGDAVVRQLGVIYDRILSR